jgi:hypothetical protein
MSLELRIHIVSKSQPSYVVPQGFLALAASAWMGSIAVASLLKKQELSNGHCSFMHG